MPRGKPVEELQRLRLHTMACSGGWHPKRLKPNSYPMAVPLWIDVCEIMEMVYQGCMEVVSQ